MTKELRDRERIWRKGEKEGEEIREKERRGETESKKQEWDRN